MPSLQGGTPHSLSCPLNFPGDYQLGPEDYVLRDELLNSDETLGKFLLWTFRSSLAGGVTIVAVTAIQPRISGTNSLNKKKRNNTSHDL
jgi:hypothetical protein